MASVRTLRADEGALVEQGFVLAADWEPGRERGADHWRDDPSFAPYTSGWGRPGDGGLVAEEDGRVVGILWWRLFSADDPGYGFVDAHTPELGLAVLPAHRGRGLGRRLLRAALDAHPRLSLNVEHGNGAIALYRAEGFVPVGPSPDGTVMLAERRAGRPG